MKQIIKTNNGDYSFEEQKFSNGIKTIDKKIAEKLLVSFKDVMDRNNIKFILAYGTLLGAVREGDFIDHDEDIDVIILDEDRYRFLDLLFEFRKSGLEVGRYEPDLLSLVKDGEYIDVYMFKKGRFGLRTMGKVVVKEEFLIDTIKYDFKGLAFDIPKNYIKYLVYHYGKDWKIPKKGDHAHNYNLVTKLKIRIKRLNPIFYDMIKRKLKKT